MFLLLLRGPHQTLDITHPPCYTFLATDQEGGEQRYLHGHIRIVRAAWIAVRPRQQDTSRALIDGEYCDALRGLPAGPFIFMETSLEEPFIRIENLTFRYEQPGESGIEALQKVNLTIQRGEYIAIMGHNGSGKSTLARHLNALILPTEGRVTVNGWDTCDLAHMVDIRRTVGMVFQVPDDQIISTVVEEDVAFGPENLGVPRPELRERVHRALETVGLWELRERPPHLLSSGQKQLLAIAGVLALRPTCIVLDEATSSLDAHGRTNVLRAVKNLHQTGLTIVAITHLVEETVSADRLLVLEQGQIVLDDTPRRAFSQPERLRQHRLDIPETTDLAQRLHRHNSHIPADCLATEELSRAILQVARKGT